MSSLNNLTHDVLMNLYFKKGIKAADAKVRQLLEQCETTSKDNIHDRGVIKGELSEVYLEYHLLWWMSHAQCLTTVKSLCMKSKESNATAEIDILLASPCRIYLFECKSFKGDKTLTKECFLKGKSSEKDVYEQSRYHLKILNEHICDCHYPGEYKTKPYKLILFELSTTGIDDQRAEQWKKTIPLLTMDTLDTWIAGELQRNSQVQWNYEKLTQALAELDAKSADMFKFHMHKIMNRR